MEYRGWSDLSFPELAGLTLYRIIFWLVTLKENGIEYSYASPNKHPYVRTLVIDSEFV
jgi:hypothetical protein